MTAVGWFILGFVIGGNVAVIGLAALCFNRGKDEE